MNYLVKELAFSDLPQLKVLFNTVLKEDFPQYQPKVALIFRKYVYRQNYFRKIIKKNVILGAFDKDRLVGFVTIKKEFGGVVFFSWVLVDKDYRSKGIATDLLRAGEKWSIKNKCHYVYLYTESLENVEFYKKRGFQYIGLQRQSWFGIDEHLLQKILRDKPFEETFSKYFKDTHRATRGQRHNKKAKVRNGSLIKTNGR